MSSSSSPAPERRRDLTKRDRIAELEDRYRRLTRHVYAGGLFVLAGILILVVAVLVGFNRIQSSREEATFRACLSDLRGNAAIHRFVLARASVDEVDRLKRELQRDFPTLPELVDERAGAQRLADQRCHRTAAARVGVTP